MKYLAVAFPYNDFAFVYFDNWIPRRSSAATAKMSKKQKSSKSKGGDSDFYPMIVPERAAARQAAMKLKEPGGRPGGQPGSAPAAAAAASAPEVAGGVPDVKEGKRGKKVRRDFL